MLAEDSQIVLTERPTIPLAALAFPAVLWGWFCWACAGDWKSSPDYAYGWLVLPLACYFLWKRFLRFDFEKRAPSGPIWVWMALGVVAVLSGPIELLRLAPIYWRPLLWAIYVLAALTTLACARLLGGHPLLKVVAFPCIFMALAVPWPAAVEHVVTFPLMMGIASIVSQILLFLGVPAIQSGTTIQLTSCIVGIEEACSGIRSLQASMMIALAIGELRALKLIDRSILLAIGVLLSLFGNILRTLFLSLAGNMGGAEMISRLHDAAGLAVLLLIVTGLGVASLFFLSTVISPGHKTKRSELPRITGSRETRRVRYPLLFLLLGLLLAHLWFFFGSSHSAINAGPRLSAREEIQASTSVQPMPKAILEVLNPTSARYILPTDGSLMAAYLLYWKPSDGNAAQMYHRPDICMPGAGWQPAGTVGRTSISLGENRSDWYVFPFERNGERAFLIWLAWMDDTPVEMDFNRNVHLQRDMLLQFLRSGRREFQYEVAAVLVYYPGAKLPNAVAEKAVKRFFKPGEGSDRN